MDLALNGMKATINEGADLTIELDLDEPRGELALEVSISGRPGTNMEKALGAFGKRLSLFGAISPAPLASIAMNMPSPKEFQAVMAKSIDDAREQAIAAAGQPKQQELAAKVIDVMKPLFTGDDFDMRADLVGPLKTLAGEDRYVLLVAMKAPNGKDISSFFRDTLANLPREEGVELHFDLAKSDDGTPVHKIVLPVPNDLDGRLFGPFAIFVAFRDDSLLFAYGDQGQAVLLDALAASAKGGARVSAPLSAVVQAKTLVELAAIINDDVAAKIGDALKDAPNGPETVRLSITAPDGVLRLRASAGIAALKLATTLGLSAQAAAANP
jgi:hypothetical protein